MRRLVRRIRPSAGADAERLLVWALSRSVPRHTLNALYNGLSLQQKSSIYRRFAKIFRKHAPPPISDQWHVDFHGRKIMIPLQKESLWLDWDTALSALGHEPEIKSTYEALLGQFGSVRRVFDVGANYGVHSLLFLIHDVDVISFEPNPECHWYYPRLERHNRVKFRLEPTALGAIECRLNLCYPENESWLGTTDPEHAQALSSSAELRQVQVPCISLDSYVKQSNLIPDLIKLDVEGSEFQILLGAQDTLQNFRPLVIFECWNDRARDRIWRILAASSYVVAGLPLLSRTELRPLEESTFHCCPGTNFAALPKELLQH